MTTNVKTAEVDDRVANCLHRMSQGRFRHLPIVDEKKKVLGMLSQGDFVAFTMSDVLSRFTKTSKAEISAGRSTPFAIAASILVYTLILIVIVRLAV
ncbi:MAG: CBS domain-containing protein [Bdellovibrionales bacterium]